MAKITVIEKEIELDKYVKYFGDKEVAIFDVLILNCDLDLNEVQLRANVLIKGRKNKIKGLTKIKRTVIL
jgi:hypothetical protein